MAPPQASLRQLLLLLLAGLCQLAVASRTGETLRVDMSPRLHLCPLPHLSL